MSDSKEFSYIWDNIISPLHSILAEEGDTDFVQTVGLRCRDGDEWRRAVEWEFHHQRHNFKEQCYGKRRTEAGDPLLDNRKVAAVLCQTLLRRKAFSFDIQAAGRLAEEKKRELPEASYTIWAVNNTLINYKFAYLAGQELVYLTLLSDLLKDEATISMAKELNRLGHLFRYPKAPGCDTMDVNVIVALARGDVKEQDLNMLLYAMLLYQNEMYTRERLNTLMREKAQSAAPKERA